jgi:hypothetical protein
VARGESQATPGQARILRGFARPSAITHWWLPEALVGVATAKSAVAVLDIDVKDPQKYGLDSLASLGVEGEEINHSILDATWVSHSPSGGFHVWYHADLADGTEIPSTESVLGPGLDTRGSTGYIIAPSPNSGYSWDPTNNPNLLPLAPAPAWLISPVPQAAAARAKPIKPAVGLSPYADAAIELACRAIRGARSGHQRTTLRDQAFSIGTLAAAGAIPPAFARAALIDAGCGMPNFNAKHPWTAKEIERVVRQCFAAGLVRPRSSIRGRS